MKITIALGTVVILTSQLADAQEKRQMTDLPLMTKIADSKASKKNETNLTKEALEVGTNYINSRFFSNCNDSMIFKYSSGLMSQHANYFQILNPVTKVLIGSPVTEIDRLNGLEWRGEVRLMGKALRVLKNKGTPNERWSEWGQRPGGFVTYAEKRNGKWDLQSAVDGSFENPETCDAIPLEKVKKEQKSIPQNAEPVQKAPTMQI